MEIDYDMMKPEEDASGAREKNASGGGHNHYSSKLRVFCPRFDSYPEINYIY